MILRVLTFVVAASLTGWVAAAEASAGDAQRGAVVYERCLACHTLARNRTGPKHCGLIGRPAGSLPDFRYSQAMKASGLIWDQESLDRFLADPTTLVPGTRMTYDGVKDAGERADLITYLAAAANDPALCP